MPRPAAVPTIDVLSIGGHAAVGWRAWSLMRGRDGRLWIGPVYGWGDPWRPLAPASATCRLSPNHGAPNPRCSCGLYAARDPSMLPGVRDAHVAIVGTVGVWGSVIEHRDGYRAEFAYPLAVRLVCSRCGKAPNVRSMVVGRARRGEPRLVAACRRHLRRPRRQVVPAREVQVDLLSTYAVDLLPGHLAGRIPGWRVAAVRRLLRSGVGRIVAAGFVLLLALTIALSAAMLTGRLPVPLPVGSETSAETAEPVDGARIRGDRPRPSRHVGALRDRVELHPLDR